MNRLTNLSAQLTKTNVTSEADDVVICSAVRTPITKAKKGYLKDTSPEVMLSVALKGALDRAKLDPKLLQDIAIGNNLQPGAG